MKTSKKWFLIICILIFGVSLFCYLESTEINMLTKYISSSKNNLNEEQKESKGRPRSKRKTTHEDQAKLEDQPLVKIKLATLAELKAKMCSESLKELSNLGDYFDSGSEMYKNPEGLVGKLDNALGFYHYANEEYKKEIKKYLIEVPGKRGILEKTEILSGCSRSGTIGVTLASTLEAMKEKTWKPEIKKKAEILFIRIAKSESSFDSWDALSKASGILLPIFLENYPNSTELQEIRSFRAEILGEMLSERKLIRRSLNENDAKIIQEHSSEKRALYREEIDRMISTMEDRYE